MSQKVAIYIRVGNESQLDTSEQQMMLCEPFLDTSDYEIYKDAGSGMKTPLPSLQKLLDDVKAGGIRKVVCAAPSIITRDFALMASVADDFKNAQVPLVRADTGTDLVSDIENTVHNYVDELSKHLKQEQ